MCSGCCCIVQVQRAAVQLDELSSEVQHSTTRMLAEEEKDISTAEEAFRRIKEATGITDIKVQRCPLVLLHTACFLICVFLSSILCL